MIANKYNVIKHIGGGSFGTIYRGENIRTNEAVAIKVEKVCNEVLLLKREANIYKYLNGCLGIPEIKWFGRDSINYYMVMPLLYESLQTRREHLGPFSLRDTIELKCQMVGILQSIHSRGLVHRDIKPDNFMFDSTHKLYIIDFGLCKKIPQIVNKREGETIIGTPNYVSINVHLFMEPTIKDDLESVGYIMLYLYLDILPWYNTKLTNTEIMHMKQKLKCDPNIPDKIAEYFTSF